MSAATAATEPREERNALDFVVSTLRDHGKNRSGRKRAPGMFHCPAHKDDTPSLSVRRGEGCARVHCYAECSVDAVVSKLGLVMADLRDEPPVSEPQCVAEYEYPGRDGEVISTKSRWEPGRNGEEKSFSWDHGNPHVLYNLPEVVEADCVHVNEGEKAADALNEILPPGTVATCSPTTGWETSFAECLSGKTATLWIDRDASGRKQATRTFEALSAAGVSVALVQSKTTSAKDDAFDHLAAGFSLAEAVPMTPEELTRGDADEPSGEPETGSDSGRFAFLGVDDLEYRIESQGLIKGFIDRGAFVVMYGASGSSKTFLALYMALCVSSGRSFHGLKVHKQMVVYVASEGAGSITNRIVAYRNQYLGNEQDAAFFLLPQPINLLDQAGDVRPLIAAIKNLETQAGDCGLVVIDTLSQSMPGGDENGPKDMTAAVDAVNLIRREIGCAVILVHHSGKDEAKGARGHSSLRAATDTELEVTPLRDGIFQVRPTKQRDYALGAPILYRLKVVEIGEDEDGELCTTCVVEPVDSDKVEIKRRRRGKLGARGEILKLCMENLFQAKRGIAPPSEVKNAHINDFKAGQFVINVSDLRELFYKRLGEDPDMSDSKPDSLSKAFRRTLESAQALENITVYGEFVWFSN